MEKSLLQVDGIFFLSEFHLTHCNLHSVIHLKSELEL